MFFGLTKSQYEVVELFADFGLVWILVSHQFIYFVVKLLHNQ
jgi:hypothetical protein